MKTYTEEELKYLASIKTNDEIYVDECGSVLQNHPIKGKVYFDSWRDKYLTLYVYVDGEPRGKRFWIDAKHIQIPSNVC
jgi:hypothetical protein